MRDVAFAVPGDLDTPTGGYRYDRAVIAGLRALGHKVRVVPLGPGFPFPSDTELADAATLLAEVPVDTVLIVDGLAFSVLPEPVLEAIEAPLVALVHHPLAWETGLDDAAVARFTASETAALAHAPQVVVTSPHTARSLARSFGVALERITVALPGLAPRWAGLGRAPVSPPRIVSVGSISPRKGVDVFIAALGLIADLDWHCDIIGGIDREGPLAAALLEAIDGAGLGGRVDLLGARSEEEIGAAFEAASVFALATRYEGFGMVFAEAMAAGLPIVGTTAGAVPDVVPPEAGRLVPPDDPAAFAAALRALLTDATLRSSLATAARQAGARFGGWEETSALISEVVEVAR